MRRLVPVVLLVTAVLAATGASAEQPVLDQPRHGADAVRVLGTEISTVARAHDTTAAELRDRLQSDLSLWVDVQGRLFYVDPPAPAGVEQAELATSSSPTPQSAAEVLKLHSKPGASRTILLDVDGVGPAYGGEIGGAWKAGYTGGDGNAEPYDTNGIPSTDFGTGEIAEIHSIWQRVAEDFAPFDVDVTTEEPGFDRIHRSSVSDSVYGTRVAITSSTTDCGCGGVAYVGVFDHYGTTYPHSWYQPAFVYNKGPKAAAEAASHEAGHNLGLNHDGTQRVGYYEGHGSWSPIMGVGYYTPISQWSRGEYGGANNAQDDFVVATSNGAPIRADDHGMGAAASPLSGSASGVIQSRTDVDEFTFSLSGPATVSLRAEPGSVSPNLDIQLTLRDSTGALVSVDDPLSGSVTKDLASGLGAGISTTLGAGSYRVSVDGVGALDPLTTGYSDYGSVGSYTLSLSSDAVPVTPVEPPPADTAPATPEGVTATLSGAEVTVAWSSSDAVTGGELLRYKQTKSLSFTLAATLPFTGSGPSLTDTPGAGTFGYAVRLANGDLWSEPSALSSSVTIAKTTSTRPQRTR